MTARLARVSPHEPMLYRDWVIPAGVSEILARLSWSILEIRQKYTHQSQTPVSQSNYFVHMDPTLFPIPHEFDPERWIRATEKGEYLSRFIVAFTKGSRQCLGIK